MERGNWDRVVGADPEKNEKAAETLENLQGSPESRFLKEQALEQTPLEKSLIQEAITRTKELAKGFGGVGRDFDPARVYVVTQEAMAKAEKDPDVAGIYNGYYDKSILRRTDSAIVFANYSVHEMIHQQGFRSFRSHPSGEVRMHRSGIMIRENPRQEGEDGGEKYLGELNEAIIATLSRAYIKDVARDNEQLAEEFRAVDEIKEWFLANVPVINPKVDQAAMRLDFEELYAFKNWRSLLKAIRSKSQYPPGSRNDVFYKLGTMERLIGKKQGKAFQLSDVASYHEYAGFRKKFSETIDRIVESSPTPVTYEDVEDTFVEAFFSGRLLKLARLVESSLGAGAFRNIAEDFKEKPDKK